MESEPELEEIAALFSRHFERFADRELYEQVGSLHLASVVLLAVVGLVVGSLSVSDVKELSSSLGLLTTLVRAPMAFDFGRATK